MHHGWAELKCLHLASAPTACTQNPKTLNPQRHPSGLNPSAPASPHPGTFGASRQSPAASPLSHAAGCPPATSALITGAPPWGSPGGGRGWEGGTGGAEDIKHEQHVVHVLGWRHRSWRRGTGRCASRTSEPRAPFPGVGMNAMRAVRAVRTLQEGCQCSGWWAEIDRHIFTPVSKRPLGESIMNAGGLNGYSAGSRMRPW